MQGQPSGDGHAHPLGRCAGGYAGSARDGGVHLGPLPPPGTERLSIREGGVRASLTAGAGRPPVGDAGRRRQSATPVGAGERPGAPRRDQAWPTSPTSPG